MVDFHKQQAAWMDRMPEAPTFFPTREQFEDPLAYIRSIQQEAAQYGAELKCMHARHHCLNARDGSR